MAFDFALNKFASLFETNTSELFQDMKTNVQMKPIYEAFNRQCTNATGEKTVVFVCDFIKHLLFNPSRHYKLTGSFAAQFMLCLKSSLDKFPFVFVIDEPDLLTNLAQGIDGFSIFKRALSYLEGSTRLMVLTLGTKCDIVKPIPRSTTVSTRFVFRNAIHFPIILSSNVNIHSNKFPIHQMVPSHTTLRNPLMFKFLASLGRAVWGSYRYSDIVRIATETLTNGSKTEGNYVTSMWMIRTGLMANPVSVNSYEFVANNMVTLFWSSNDLQGPLVSYPSEPILALASRKIIKDLSRHPSDPLFSALKEYLECAVISNEKYSEVITSMIILLIVDKLENAINREDYYTNLTISDLSCLNSICSGIRLI